MTASARTSSPWAGPRGRPSACTGIALLALVVASGCSAPAVQLAAPVPAPQRGGIHRAGTAAEVAALGSRSASQISSETLWVVVRDARQERPPRAIGVARMTMGIPRQIRQAGGWDLARAIGHGLGTGLQNSGWEAAGFDPPDPRLAMLAAGSPLPGWTLRLVLDRLWCDGYFNEYSFQLGLRLHLLDPSGGLRGRAEFRKEYVEEYQHPADFAYQVEVKTREALSTLLRDLGLANFPPEAALSESPVTSPQDTETTKDGGEPQGPACPKCERRVESAWKHCPDCGTSLGERE